MRPIGRLIVLAAALLLAAALFRWVWHSLEWSDVAATVGGRIQGALPSAAYVAVDGQWLTFALDADVSALRIRSNATTGAATPAGRDIVWWYAFEYQVLDGGGEVLRDGLYYHRTRTSRYLDPRTGRTATRGFLLDPAVVPTDGRSLRLSLEDTEGAARLRLRPVHRDPPLTDILFRVYERRSAAPRHLAYLWQRLGEAQRIRFARASVYGPDLLREEEKQNLLKRQWRVVGPVGADGTDYGVERLYFPREFVGDVVDKTLMPRGLYMSPGARAMIPLPEGEQAIFLEFADAGDADPSGLAGDVRVLWHGPNAGQSWETRVMAAPGVQQLDASLAGGLLELTPDRPLVVQAWVDEPGGRVEITPQHLRLRTYRADPADPLVFRVDHVDGAPTPFRLDMRALLAPGEIATEARAEYLMLDAGGNELGRGVLRSDLMLSNYDRVSSVGTGVAVTEPAAFYFALPANVASMRIAAGPELWFAAYTRPRDLDRIVRVPQDYQAYRADELAQPAWFVLLPNEAQRLRVSLRSESLLVQPRPPTTDPRLLAGQYDWELFLPEGDWRGRHLLVTREEGLPLREQSRGAVFRELTAGEERVLQVSAPAGRSEIEPRLVFIRERSAPMTVRIDLDGEQFFSGRVNGRHGELRLPSVTPGRHVIRLEAPEPARWYLSHLDGDGQAYLRRMGMHLDGDGLEFPYQKRDAGEDVLTGVFYASEATRAALRVRIEHAGETPVGPAADWTFTERVFDVKPDATSRVPVLNTDGEAVFGGQRFFVPLGTGLPPGAYRVRVATGGGETGYFTLYRLVPGQPVTREFFRERLAGFD